MSGKLIKAKLAAGDTVFGMFLQYMTNPAVVDILPDHGLDFVVVNEEHNALNMSDFLAMQYALRSKGIACLVRIHNRDPEQVAKACDAYADGVVVPYVEDVAELKRLAAAAIYRPLKGAQLERLIETGEWPSAKTREWIEAKCANTLFCPMIESVTAIGNIEALCTVPGVDAVFVGPNDLTISMGIPEERDHPDFIDAMQRIIDTAARHGIAAGAHFANLAHATRALRQGARFIPFSSDLRLIQTGVSAFLEALRGDIRPSSEQII